MKSHQRTQPRLYRTARFDVYLLRLRRLFMHKQRSPSACPEMTYNVLLVQDGMQLEDRASVTPPQSPTGPGYTYPPRVRAPPRHMKVASATSLAAAQSNTTSGLVLASTALAGFQPQQQEQIRCESISTVTFHRNATPLSGETLSIRLWLMCAIIGNAARTSRKRLRSQEPGGLKR